MHSASAEPTPAAPAEMCADAQRPNASDCRRKGRVSRSAVSLTEPYHHRPACGNLRPVDTGRTQERARARERARRRESWWTLGEVARAAGVKQELAVLWVRRGWLVANRTADGTWRVRRRAWARALRDPRVVASIADSRIKRARARPAPGSPSSALPALPRLQQP